MFIAFKEALELKKMSSSTTGLGMDFLAFGIFLYVLQLSFICREFLWDPLAILGSFLILLCILCST